MASLRIERDEACARARAAGEKLTLVEREHYRTQHQLTTVTEVAGEMASKRLALERDLGMTRTQLRTAMSLLDAVRTIPELVLDIASEGRAEPLHYERAEQHGVSREVESVNQVHAILLAMKSSRTVSDARERVFLSRIQALEVSAGDAQKCVDMLSEREEDTRKVRVDSFEES